MFKHFLLITFLGVITYTDIQAQTTTNRQTLEKLATDHKKKEELQFENLKKLAREKGWPEIFETKEGNLVKLVGVDHLGLPQYFTVDNLIAAATTGASNLWKGGSNGLELSGASDNVKGKLGVWDESKVLLNHLELDGRVVQKDNQSSISNHATHVAGTMIASGVNATAKGMAFGIKQLVAYDFSQHIPEIAAEAPNLLISNHSYGTITGWHYNSSQSRWEFYGRADDFEDHKFGYYNSEAQIFDSIAYNAPYYLIVKSAGNNRSQNGPAVGTSYWRYNSSGQMVSAGERPSGLSSNDGYDIIPTYGNAKNILTVGAINGIANGYNKTADVKISSFSSWGPTDDGRIKPDVVGNGVNVLSTSSTGGYAILSGTSMSAPNVSGSLILLQDYYSQLNEGAFMRAATLKGLTIHTADEAGDGPGPDYRHGWGLVNVSRAAEVIKTKNTGNFRIHGNILANGETFSTTVIASGKGPLMATISWTDPKGTVETVDVLNNRSLKLVHDLDIRITSDTTTFLPWRLDPSLPDFPAVPGDNFRDNVERIDILNPLPGKSYTITISHKGQLERGSQAYSLIISGIGGQAYCNSSATATAGTRIDSVSLAGIRKKNVAGCTSYQNYTNLSAVVEPFQKVPFAVYLNQCSGSPQPQRVKMFIDFNNNGSFDDAGEMVATSNSIEGAGVFSGTISIPGTVTPGHFSVIRIVTQQTTDAESISSCGSYINGETQDYLIGFAGATNDLSVEASLTDAQVNCASSSQLINVNIRNRGTVNKTNIPIEVEVKNGSTTVASSTFIMKETLTSGEVIGYTLPLTFNAVAGNTYTVRAILKDPLDQIQRNDTLQTTLTVANAPAAPTGVANICSGSANLQVSNPQAGREYFWYASTAANAPVVGRGNFITTTNIPDNSTYYLRSGINGGLGMKSKDLAPNGGGYLSSTGNFIRYSSTVPVVLESARIYSKFGGKVDISVIEPSNENSNGGYSYKTLTTVTIDVPTTSPTPAAGSVAEYDAADTGAIVRINLPIPAGFYAIRIATRGSTNLFRNNNITNNPYPFDVPGVISFHSNSASMTSTDPNYHQSFYYYLYDAKIRTTDCVSERATIVAKTSPKPVVTLVNDSLVSSIATGNQWYLNGSAISGANTNKFKPTQSGEYMVMVLDTLNCMQSSAPFAFTITAVDPVRNAEVSFNIAPVPNNGLFTVSMNLSRREDLRMDFVNAQGQTVLSRTFSKVQGRFNESVNLQNHASGVYMVRIQYGGTVYFNKIVIQR